MQFLVCLVGVLDFVNSVSSTLKQLVARAEARNQTAVHEVCKEFAADLLRNPRPTPSIPRGFLAAELIRAEGFKPLVQLGPSKKPPSPEQWRRSIRAAVSGVLKAARQPLEDYVRYEFPKFADGYLALIEGDHKSVTSALAALTSIAQSSSGSFAGAREIFGSSNAREQDNLLDLISSEGCAVLLSPYDRHLRNALTHKTYTLEGEILRYADRSHCGEISLVDFAKKFYQAWWINQAAATALVKDDASANKLCRYWDPDFFPKASSETSPDDR